MSACSAVRNDHLMNLERGDPDEPGRTATNQSAGVFAPQFEA